MRYAYIGEVESREKAEYICSNHSNVIISGITHKGNYELSVVTESKRLVDMWTSALARNKI